MFFLVTFVILFDTLDDKFNLHRSANKIRSEARWNREKYSPNSLSTDYNYLSNTDGCGLKDHA